VLGGHDGDDKGLLGVLGRVDEAVAHVHGHQRLLFLERRLGRFVLRQARVPFVEREQAVEQDRVAGGPFPVPCFQYLHKK